MNEIKQELDEITKYLSLETVNYKDSNGTPYGAGIRRDFKSNELGIYDIWITRGMGETCYCAEIHIGDIYLPDLCEEYLDKNLPKHIHHPKYILYDDKGKKIGYIKVWREFDVLCRDKNIFQEILKKYIKQIKC